MTAFAMQYSGTATVSGGLTRGSADPLRDVLTPKRVAGTPPDASGGADPIFMLSGGRETRGPACPLLVAAMVTLGALVPPAGPAGPTLMVLTLLLAAAALIGDAGRALWISSTIAALADLEAALNSFIVMALAEPDSARRWSCSSSDAGLASSIVETIFLAVLLCLLEVVMVKTRVVGDQLK